MNQQMPYFKIPATPCVKSKPLFKTPSISSEITARHLLLTDLPTDTGSVFSPSSDFDFPLVKPIFQNEQLMPKDDAFDCDEFLKNVFDSEEEDVNVVENADINKPPERPIISFSGKYNIDSSDTESQAEDHHVECSTVNETDSFFNIENIDLNIGVGLISPTKRITRATYKLLSSSQSVSPTRNDVNSGNNTFSSGKKSNQSRRSSKVDVILPNDLKVSNFTLINSEKDDVAQLSR